MNPTPARRHARRIALAVATATAAVTLAACGGTDRPAGDGSPSAPASPSASAASSKGAHNAQDVAFAQGMIPHHRQALEMAALADGRARSPEVTALARRIEGAQEPEIRTMSGWLTSWDEKVPEARDHGDMPGMDHGSGHDMSAMPRRTSMPGMMGDGEMAALRKASGPAFDTAFLKLMVEHHKGAVEMAGTERAKGAYGPAKKLADDIIRAQRSEIEQMDRLLAGH
ncbi:DUF305 domain-containing protein [Streptomyces sp. LP05-1]|uniref:DUF305 domain-containing protein n=2 Tax=Streptomyces pyxinae TaxID=2970734 RepID=A0ABT2CCC4_9ACTN|nr:DUF305 domain-containing protein [Streptomyces sp. LP05-1]MCS0635067.1 DUF305 domain-containing protein [Streptomyces sp. LP05-1]